MMMGPTFDSGTEPFEDFQFQPLTEGLGFHKKPDSSKADTKAAGFSSGASVSSNLRAKSDLGSLLNVSTSINPPAAAAAGSHEFSRPVLEVPKASTQSITDLIASLPPSLDFLEHDSETSTSASSSTLSSKAAQSGHNALGLSGSMSTGGLSNSGVLGVKPGFDIQSALESTDSYSSRPQIFQPLAREEYASPQNSGMTANPTIGSANSVGATVGSYLSPMASKSTGGGIAPSAPVVPAAAASGPAVKPPSHYRERLDESFARAFPHAEKSKTTLASDVAQDFEPSSGHLGAGILDGMVIAGLATILLVCILAITRINLIGMLNNAQTDLPTQINLALLGIAVLQIYTLSARAFFGSTLGEWAFDLQLGLPEDQRRALYPIQVAWRTLVLTATGIVTLPILSLLFRRDLGKFLSGLQIYRRK
jgi:hypothetical protein